jgi:hypothetical protein
MQSKIALLLVSCTFGWGPKGHFITTRVAIDHLTQSAKLSLGEILAVGQSDFAMDFVRISTEADDMEDDETAEYHFVHSTFRTCEPYLESRDCGYNRSGRCLVTGIARYAGEFLRADSASARLDATKMLVHLMADLHQPLHSGFSEDHGGLDITILSPPDYSLHGLWDSYLIQSDEIQSDALKDIAMRIRKTANAIINTRGLVDTHTPEELESVIHTWVTNIVTEMTHTYTCPKAYVDETGSWLARSVSLSPEYLSDRSAIASELLAMAGVRMALLFNTLTKYMDQRRDRIASAVRETIAESARMTALAQPTNIFELLVIEEFSFDPEEFVYKPPTVVVVPKAKKSGSKKKKQLVKSEDVIDPLTGELDPPVTLHGVRLEMLVLWKSPSGAWYVTYSGLLETVRVSGSGRPIEFSFPKNEGSKRFTLYFDAQVFPSSSVSDAEFLRVVLSRLRGIKRAYNPVATADADNARLLAGPIRGNLATPFIASIPIGESVVSPTGEYEFTRVAQEDDHDDASVTCGLALSTESSERESKKRDIRRTVAARMFPHIIDGRLLLLTFFAHDLRRRCGSIVMIRYENKLEMLTTIDRLQRSDSKPKKPMRVTTFPGLIHQSDNSRVDQLVDSSILDEVPDDRWFHDKVHECGRANYAKNSEALAIRPTIQRELAEVYRAMSTETTHIDDPSSRVVVDRILAFVHPHAAWQWAWFVEWDLK